MYIEDKLCCSKTTVIGENKPVQVSTLKILKMRE